MQSVVDPNQPRQKFFFYVAQDVNEQVKSSVRNMVEQLAVSRSWTIEPPRFVDVLDGVEEGSTDDPIVTVGGELDIYSALAPASLPKDIDCQHLEEVESIVEEVRKLSKAEGLAFEFELDGTYVGTIEGGEIDRTLRIGLLEEWRNHLK